MRLIDADELMMELDEREPYDDFESEHELWSDMLLDVIKAPTVDAVEVVRCRDCTHGSQYDDGSDNYVCRLGGTKKGSGFCSDGERR